MVLVMMNVPVSRHGVVLQYEARLYLKAGPHILEHSTTWIIVCLPQAHRRVFLVQLTFSLDPVIVFKDSSIIVYSSRSG